MYLDLQNIKQIPFSCVNLCDVILAYLEFLSSYKDYMLEKIFKINSNWIRVHTTVPLNLVRVIDSFHLQEALIGYMQD